MGHQSETEACESQLRVEDKVTLYQGIKINFLFSSTSDSKSVRGREKRPSVTYDHVTAPVGMCRADTTSPPCSLMTGSELTFA
ncbi:hypothetical protein CEXT_706471 [Caerostris extrusa]|uniref:Uncharacterized protein n=1 Tax=Caerostris extrusa TaxID=172846 RepID=A0AAV4SAX8_CAEEX|nr:hypothetical protein CEXT_706471 [Caerostris extrusa]